MDNYHCSLQQKTGSSLFQAKRSSKYPQFTTFTRIERKMQAEGSKHWQLLGVHIYHKLWASATAQWHNPFLGQAGSGHITVSSFPQKINVGPNHRGLWSMRFQNTAMTWIKLWKEARWTARIWTEGRQEADRSGTGRVINVHLWGHELPALL